MLYGENIADADTYYCGCSKEYMLNVGCVSDVVLPEFFGKVEAKVCHCKDADYCNGSESQKVKHESGEGGGVSGGEVEKCAAVFVAITLLTACAFVVFCFIRHFSWNF